MPYGTKISLLSISAKKECQTMPVPNISATPDKQQEPWETLGISRRTYFRQKSSATDGAVSAKDDKGVPQPPCPDHPNNIHDITKGQMKAIIDAGQSFVPNWYAAGFKCKEAGIQHAIQSVRSREK
jgi:hypothetical protein